MSVPKPRSSELGERKEGRRQEEHWEEGLPWGQQGGGAARRRQSADPEGRGQRTGQGIYRGDAGVEARRRSSPRQAHRAGWSRGAQGGQGEVALDRTSVV